jgi:hypothetical protein
MAFENPLLRPSATRQAALQYLWSDEPESAIQASPAPSSSSSSIANFFGVGEASPSTAPADSQQRQQPLHRQKAVIVRQAYP